MEDDNGAPAKKKELHARIRQCIDTLLQTSQESTEKAEAAFAVLRDADCEEAFAALVQVFKAPNAAQWCRERAVDLMYESARGRYNGVLNSIRLMLLEDVMRLYSRFSMSSIAVGGHFALSLPDHFPVSSQHVASVLLGSDPPPSVQAVARRSLPDEESRQDQDSQPQHLRSRLCDSVLDHA